MVFLYQVGGVDISTASHEQAVAAIRYAKSPVRFVVKGFVRQPQDNLSNSSTTPVRLYDFISFTFFVRLLIRTYSFTYFVHLSARLVFNSFTLLFILSDRSFVHSFGHSFFRSFVLDFVPSFVCLPIRFSVRSQ